MIIISVFGGIGNQMFQFALGKSLSNNLTEKVKYDYSYNLIRKDFNPDDIDSIFNIFELDADFATQEEIHFFKGPQKTNIRLLSKCYQIIYRSIHKNSRKIIFEKNPSFDEKILQLTGDVYLHGYWQSEKYFFQIQDVLLRDFKFKALSDERLLSISHKIQMTESVSVHLRGRDYLTNSLHFTCDIEYYKRCFEYIKRKVKDPHFYIFSDDMDWARKYIKIEDPHTFVDINKWNRSSICDMMLMSLCKNNIIANSSFSWWAAWLNINPNKIVLAPTVWFNNSKINSDDIIPEGWVRI